MADLALAANEKLFRIIYNETELTTEAALELTAKIISAGYERATDPSMHDGTPE